MKDIQKDIQIEYITGKTGLETIKVNNYFLHSKYNPIREATEFAKKNYRIGDVHILFGYGNGYFVDALVKEFISNEKLIVIEPLLSTVDIEKEDVIIIQSNSIEKIIENIDKYSYLFSLNNINVLCSPNYDKICPDLYKDFLLKLKERVVVNRVNMNTINFMAHEWQRNYIYNIKNAIHDDSIAQLYKYTNSPVIVASGGPSLTKQIPLLKKIRENVILISSGSTVNSLLKENIEPDYVVSIDSQELNYNHFKDLKLNKAKLIYHMQHHYKIRDSFLTNAYYFVSKGDNALASHLAKVVNTSVVAIEGGASVAAYAFTIANYISSGPIALIGQDLAYTDNKSHAENNKHFRLITEETIKSKGLFYIEGYYGDKVLSDNSFLSMKYVFEKLIKLNNINENVYNCTEGGAKLNGFNQIPFNQFIENFISNDVVTKPIRKEKKNVNYIEIIKFFNDELKIYKNIRNLVNENLRLISMNKSNTHFSDRVLKKMNNNDAIIEEERKSTCLQVIMDPLNITILKNFKPKNNETPVEAYTRVVQQSKKLYKGYLEAIDITKEYIEDLCEELKLEGE